MNYLVVDVGNSLAKLAVFDDDLLVHKESVKTLKPDRIEALREEFSLNHMLLSSVKQLEEKWLNKLRKTLEVFVLNASLPLPVKLSYETPETLGSDRIAGAVAGYAHSKPAPVLVIDSGTCITYDVVDENGVYLGGQISPGLTMRLQAMHHFTHRLPRARMTTEVPEIGNSTIASLQGGAFHGVVHEINGFTEFYKQKFSNLQVIMTGGSASLFVPKLKYEIFAIPELIIIGLNQILKYNVEG